MKHSPILLAAAALLIFLPSCRFIKIGDQFKEQIESEGELVEASKDYVTREEAPGEFRALRCNLPADVTYTPGDYALSFDGPDNILSHINVSNENGTLVIQSDGARFRNAMHLKVSLSSPSLDEAEFNGAVDFQAPDGITATDFNATVRGAGDIEISGLKAGKATLTVNGAGDTEVSDIDCETLTVSINGAGDAVVSGRTGHAELSISGAGDIDAHRLRARSHNSQVRGIGKIKEPQKSE